MKSNYKKLIEILKQQTGPVSAADLAIQMGVSLRSVKNYVSELNSSESSKVIVSSRQGYRLAPGYQAELSYQTENIPQTYLERAYYLIKKVLIQHELPNVFDLCDELYISYSTFKQNLSKMNQTFEIFHVHFVCRENHFLIEGKEKDKRRLASYVIFEETNGHFLDVTDIKKSFPNHKVEAIGAIIKDTFTTHGFYLNDFAFMNIVLHFIIVLDRVRYGKSVEPRHMYFDHPKEKSLVEDLSRQLEAEYHLLLSDNERSEISMLVRANINLATKSGADDIREAVGPYIMEAAIQLADGVRETYDIDLNHDNFLLPFSLHLKGLLTRIAQKRINKNPMLENIRQNCRIIYDIAVFIALQINRETDQKLAEDEIGFIALHVGAELERQRKNTQKIRCVLLCPEYRGIETMAYNQLMLSFSSEIEILAAVASPEELKDYTFELLFSTVPVKKEDWLETQLISPFRLAEMHVEILEKIQQVKSKIKRGILRRKFPYIFSEDLFYPDPPFKTKDELLETVCKDMEVLGYVNPDFIDKVLERDAASTTAFGKIALPHSVHMDALRTSIAVIVSRQGILWNDGKMVNLVLLTAINKVDSSSFSSIYEALLSILDDERDFDFLCNISKFSELEQLFTS